MTLILVLIVTGYYISQTTHVRNPDNQLKTSTSVSTHIRVSQTISTESQGKKKEETMIISRGSTALDLLKKISKVQMKGEGANAFITSINGRAADDIKKEFWAFYINGKQAEVGAGSYVLKDNDKIEWKLETY